MSGNCQGTLRCRCVKYNSPVLVAFLSVAPLCALSALCTTNPQIRRQPRRNFALADNARQCMVCTSLVAASPRCALCTTNPQIRRQPRRNVALADNARQCMVCTSLVAASPRCGESSLVALKFQPKRELSLRNDAIG